MWYVLTRPVYLFILLVRSPYFPLFLLSYHVYPDPIVSFSPLFSFPFFFFLFSFLPSILPFFLSPCLLIYSFSTSHVFPPPLLLLAGLIRLFLPCNYSKTKKCMKHSFKIIRKQLKYFSFLF